MQFQKISILLPRNGFCFAPLLPPGNSSSASYFASKILAFKTPVPLEISDVLRWVGYGFFLELHNPPLCLPSFMVKLKILAFKIESIPALYIYISQNGLIGPFKCKFANCTCTPTKVYLIYCQVGFGAR